jgi:hypothetical protein
MLLSNEHARWAGGVRKVKDCASVLTERDMRGQRQPRKRPIRWSSPGNPLVRRWDPPSHGLLSLPQAARRLGVSVAMLRVLLVRHEIRLSAPWSALIRARDIERFQRQSREWVGAREPPQRSTAGPPAAEWSPASVRSWQGPTGAGESETSVTVSKTAAPTGTTGLPHFGTRRAPTPWTCGDNCARGLDG